MANLIIRAMATAWQKKIIINIGKVEKQAVGKVRQRLMKKNDAQKPNNRSLPPDPIRSDCIEMTERVCVSAWLN